jgi:hypothetical protein
MSFVWFRKHQKIFLWLTVIFSVLIFATFSGLSDLQRLIQGRSELDLAGRFVVLSTGELYEVPVRDFLLTRTRLNRLYYRTRGQALEDQDVWRHIILLADARGAGLAVTDSEVANAISGGRPMSQQDYQAVWRALQFSSARELESLIRETLMVERWSTYLAQSARIVDADDVYLRWRVDNERIDLEALVVPDLEPEEIQAPPREELLAWFEEQSEAYREARYKEDARHDIIFGWLPLDADAEQVPDERLAGVPEPDEQQVTARFDAVKATRFPDLEAPDDEVRAILSREIRLAALVQQTLGSFETLAVEEKSAESFLTTVEQAGLQVGDPPEALGPEELEQLDPIGDQLLKIWLSRLSEGGTHFGQTTGEPGVAYTLYVQEVVPSRPLGFDEAYDLVLDDWKERQRDRGARDLRERIRELTRELEDVAGIITPLEEAGREEAERMVEEAVAADPELSEEDRADLLERMLENIERRDVWPRLAEHEHRVWEQLELPEAARRVELSDVPRNYGSSPDPEEDGASIERFLKTNPNVFRLDANAITDVLRHQPSRQSAIVRVVERRFPDREAMAEDPEGMASARQQLATQRELEARVQFTPEHVMETHQLQVVQAEEEQPSPDEPPTPDEAPAPTEQP